MPKKPSRTVIIALTAVVAVLLGVTAVVFMLNRQRTPSNPPEIRQRELPPPAEPVVDRTPTPDLEEVTPLQPTPRPDDQVSAEEVESLLCRFQVQLSAEQEIDYTQVAFELLTPGAMPFKLSNNMPQTAERMVGGAETAAQRLAANRIVEAWPPSPQPDGIANIAVGRELPAVLRAVAPGGLTGTISLRQCRSGIVQLNLVGNWDLRGKVVSFADKSPVPRFSFAAFVDGGARQIVTDEQGEFSLLNLEGDSHLLVQQLAADPRGFSFVESGRILTRETAGDTVTLQVTSGRVAFLRVVDEAGEPIPEVFVSLLPAGQNAPAEATAYTTGYGTTNDEGIVALQIPDALDVNLRAHKEDYETFQTPWSEIQKTGDNLWQIEMVSPRSVILEFYQEGAGAVQQPMRVYTSQLENMDLDPRAWNLSPHVLPEGFRYHEGTPPLRIEDLKNDLPLQVSAITEDGDMTAQAVFSAQEVEDSFIEGTALRIPMRLPEPVQVRVTSLTGEIPQDYQVFAEYGSGNRQRKRFQAAEVRVGDEPQGDTDTLLLTFPPLMPFKIELRGPDNFLGQAVFTSPQEVYELDASQKKFVQLSFYPPGTEGQPDPRLNASLIVLSTGEEIPLQGGVFKGYLPFGNQELAVAWTTPEGESRQYTETLEITWDAGMNYEIYAPAEEEEPQGLEAD